MFYNMILQYRRDMPTQVCNKGNNTGSSRRYTRFMGLLARRDWASLRIWIKTSVLTNLAQDPGKIQAD